MKASRLALALSCITGCTIGLPPPNVFPDGECAAGTYEVGEVSLERSSCMVYSRPSGEFGVLRPGASGALAHNCDGGYAGLSLWGTGSSGEEASWLLTGELAEGRVEMSTTGTQRANDDCTWEFVHRVTGSLEQDSLTYGYEETLAPGSSEADCAPGCIARAAVRRRSAPRP